MPGLGQGHKGTKTIELFSIIAFLIPLRLINEKTSLFNLDELVKSLKSVSFVIPAEAGIQ